MPLPFELNSNLADLPVYQPGRPIEEVAREYGLPVTDVIKLASNENPLGPSPAAIAAIQQALQSLHLYPDGNCFYLKNKIAERLGVETSNLILGNGSNEIIEFIGHAMMRPGVDVIVSQYCFAVYPIVTKLFGANLITVPARNHGHDLNAMLHAVTPNTRVMFVANPNNPTGTLAPRGDVIQLINKLPSSVLLVMDEAYLEFLDDPIDLLPLVRLGFKPNLILMRTFSKIYGLAGLRLGYGIGHPEFIAALEKIRQPFNINALIQAGATAALYDNEHLRRTRHNNTQGIQYFIREFRQMNLEFVPSAANFILVKVGDGQKVFEDLQKRGVIARPMAGYNLPQWLRISIGSSAENARCMSMLKEALAPAPAIKRAA
jgi:histidinol-phosphate aminotransferase